MCFDIDCNGEILKNENVSMYFVDKKVTYVW